MWRLFLILNSYGPVSIYQLLTIPESVPRSMDPLTFFGNMMNLMSTEKLITYHLLEEELRISGKELSAIQKGEDKSIYQYVLLPYSKKVDSHELFLGKVSYICRRG